MQILLQEGNYEIFYIQYLAEYAETVTTILKKISRTYAIFKCIPYSSNLDKQIHPLYQQVKLTKRKVIFAIIMPIDNPEVCPAGSKRISITPNPTTKNDIYFNHSSLEIVLEVELIKRFQLDSIWVGLLYRIGTDVEELEQYLEKEEAFETQHVGLINQFYGYLEELLSTNKQLNFALLEESRQLVQSNENILSINCKVEELIRSLFNQRIILADITKHSYIHLLTSRNYFNLIYIEGQIFKRFQNFTKRTLSFFPHIKQQMDFVKFTLLDDYIYSNFIFGCLSKAKKYINRTIDQQSYAMVVAKHHKDIIRQFRPSYHEYFLYICLVLKERAACIKEAVGSIIVRNNKIISTGYNGTPVGTTNCYNGGCLVCNNSEKMGTVVLSCRCIHAEYNCILKAGISATSGAVLYSSKIPCLWCAKLIIQGRIAQVICIRSKYIALEYQNVELVKKTLREGRVVVQEMDISFNQ